MKKLEPHEVSDSVKMEALQGMFTSLIETLDATVSVPFTTDEGKRGMASLNVAEVLPLINFDLIS